MLEDTGRFAVQVNACKSVIIWRFSVMTDDKVIRKPKQRDG